MEKREACLKIKVAAAGTVALLGLSNLAYWYFKKWEPVNEVVEERVLKDINAVK
jgi:hypothetical protein